MTVVQRGLNLFAGEERKKAIQSIISYFLSERNEEIGIIAATSILDFFEQNIAPNIYNKAIDDARTLTRKELEEWEYKLSDLRKD